MLLAAALAGLPATPALAEDSAPRRLLPAAPAMQGAPAPASVPLSPMPLPAAPVSAPARDPVPPPASRAPSGLGADAGAGAGADAERDLPKGFTAAPLPDVNPESVGLLDEKSGGLGPDLWRGSSRSRIERWIARLPAAVPSPAMRDLMRRLLLTAAPAPMREMASTDPSAGPGPGLVGLRAERLLAMGDREAAEALAKTAGDNVADSLLSEVHVDALLLAGDDTGACREARDAVGRAPSRYLHKVLIFCDALEGERDKVQLGLELLRENPGEPSEAQAAAADSTFLGLIDLVVGRGGRDDDAAAMLEEPTPLQVALLRAAGKPLPPDIYQRADLPVLAALLEGLTSPVASSGSPERDRLARLRAAERGVTYGVLAVPTLVARYEAMPFEDVSAARAFSLRDNVYDEELRAFLHQAVAQTVDPGQRAQLLTMRLRMARKHGDYLMVVRAAEDQLRRIPASPELLWFADEGARGLYAVRRVDDGRAWFDLLRQMVAPGSHGDRMVSRLWPLARLADSGGSPLDPERLRDWWEFQRSGHSDFEAERRVALLFSMFDALGEPPPGFDWLPTLADPRREADATPAEAVWRSLAAASQGGRKGETVLAALIAIAEASPQGDLGQVNALIAREALAALCQVGLESEARAVALDVALAAGF